MSGKPGYTAHRRYKLIQGWHKMIAYAFTAAGRRQPEAWHHASGNAEDAGDASADDTLRQMTAKDCQGSLSRDKAEGSSPPY